MTLRGGVGSVADEHGTARIAERLKLCQEDVAARPYSHPVATGWYAEDVAAIAAREQTLRQALEKIARTPASANYDDPEFGAGKWVHWAQQARAALAADAPAPTESHEYAARLWRAIAEVVGDNDYDEFRQKVSDVLAADAPAPEETPAGIYDVEDAYGLPSSRPAPRTAPEETQT